jgi:hypothetical protein
MQHDCGIGTTVDEPWHHVHQEGSFLAKSKQGWKAIPEKDDGLVKEVAKDVKKDKRGKGKEIEWAEDDMDVEVKNLSL